MTVPFPALAELRDGRFLVVGAFAADKVLLQDPRRLTSAAVLLREDFSRTGADAGPAGGSGVQAR